MSHEQILNDERLAIILSQTEAEEWDSTLEPNRKFIDSRNHRHPDISAIDRRFNDHFSGFVPIDDLNEFGAISDTISTNAIAQMFRALEIDDHPREEIKTMPVRRNPNIQHREEVKSSQNFNQNIRSRGNAGSNRRYINRNQRNPLVNNGIEIARQGLSNRGERNHNRSRRANPINDVGNYMFDDDEGASYEQLIQLDDQNFDKGNGYSETELRRLPVNFYVEKKFQGKGSCSICMTDFKLNEKVTQLKCEHVYHESCIKEWLSRKKSCAVCKKDIRI